MNYLVDGVKQGLGMLISFDKDVWEIVFLSLAISTAATVIAGLIGIPCAIFLSLREFRLKRAFIWLINTTLAVPSVFIGLVIYLLISRRGPFGRFALLFTPYAIMIGQAVLATPITTALTLSALKRSAKNARDLSYSLGAGRFQMIFAVISESKFAVLAAIIAAFSRVIGETGLSLMVGGNIRGYTRVMTTAISLETMKGNFELGIALGVVLLFVAVIVNLIMHLFQGE